VHHLDQRTLFNGLTHPPSAMNVFTKRCAMRRIGCWSVLALLVLVHPARAQSRVFVSGDVTAEMQRLSSESASAADARTFGGGADIGARVNERWDVRTEVELGGESTRMRPLLTGVSAFQSRTRTRIGATSLLVGFRPLVASRIALTVLGGISFLHVKTQIDSVPSGLVVVPRTQRDNVAGPTIGAELPIVLFGHISLVPEVRAHAFTLQRDGGGGFAIRPGVAVRWTQ
jgi:hypothetical protein